MRFFSIGAARNKELRKEKTMKKIISLVLVFALAMSFTLVPSLAEGVITPVPTEGMDLMDAAIAGYFFAGDINEREENVNASGYVGITNIVPLYDTENTVVAYYITYSTGVYAVINNNPENPEAIEFGAGTQHYIEDALSKNANARLVYSNPVSVFTESEIAALPAETRAQFMNLSDCYTDLDERNDVLAAQVQGFKETLTIPDISVMGDGDYGFIKSREMPSGTYSSDMISKARYVDWAKMSDYDSIAYNHCRPTAITNLALYYATRGYSNLKINNSKWDTFVAIHALTNSGATLDIISYANTYFNNRSYEFEYASVDDAQGFKSATTKERPVGVLLLDGINSAHWVIGVGWRTYSGSSDFYVRINNGWDGTVDTFYKLNVGSLMVRAASVWIP